MFITAQKLTWWIFRAFVCITLLHPIEFIDVPHEEWKEQTVLEGRREYTLLP